MAIKISKKLDSEINRVIRNFNRKVNRLEKLQTKHLPSKIKKSEIIENFTGTGYDLRRKLNELKRFSKRGAEKAARGYEKLDLSIWELETLKKNRQASIRNLKKELKEYEDTSLSQFGKSMGITRALMFDNNYIAKKRTLEELQRTRLRDLETKEIVQKFKRRFEREIYSSNETTLRENQFSALEKLGYASGFPEDKMKEIKEYFLRISTKEFINLFNNDTAIKVIMEKYRQYRMNVTHGVYSLEEMDMQDETYGYFNELYDFVKNERK